MTDLELYDDDDDEEVPGVDDMLAAAADLARVTAEAEELAAANPADAAPGSALVPVGGLDATSMKAALATHRALVIKKRAEVEAARAELERVMRAQLAEASRVLEPMREMVARLEDGIRTVNLYLGRDEELVTLREGEPAPASTPITVRQLVLAMDQESLVAAEDGGIDARSIDAFDEWLLADDAHVEQVIPEERGVVVLVPTFREKDYGDPWATNALNKANQQSYWLIRNGERLVRMSTDFNVGRRLVPTSDEFTGFFRERRWQGPGQGDEWVPLEPGTDAWMRAEKAADARRRHYMKVAMILEGLLHRTTVFAPLHPEASFINMASYDAGHVRIIIDAEKSIGTSRQPFLEWLRERNAQLRPGMRVIGAFNGEEWRNESMRAHDRNRDGHTRVTPRDAGHPASNVLYTLDGRKVHEGASMLTFHYDRPEKRWGYERPDDPWDRGAWGDWPYKKRATCYVHPRDRWIIPFDLVTVAEMEGYLAARLERAEYVSMVPLLKAAIAAKHAEVAEEAPFRQLLAGELARHNQVSIPEAEAAVDELVDWWKLANRWHRPLVGDDDAQAKALRMIVREHAARLQEAKVTGGTGEQAVLERLRSRFGGAVAIFRKRDLSWVVYQAADGNNVFVHQTNLTKRLAETTKEWVLPRGWQKWRLLWSFPERWDAWNHTATLAEFLTGPELDELAARARDEVVATLAGRDEPGVPLAVSFRRRRNQGWGDDGNRLKVWVRVNHAAPTMPDRPLTVGLPRDDVRIVPFRWARSRAGLELTSTSWYNETHWDWSQRSWLSTAHEPPWERDGPGHEVLWRNEEAIAEALAHHAEGAAIEEVIAGLDRQASARFREISTQWEAAREAVEYARFLEDFGDPELWEGHRKGVKGLEFPYHRHNSVLERIVERAVESGLPVGGRTVAEVAGVLAGEKFIIPEDVADLRFAEADPDTDDEDLEE